MKVYYITRDREAGNEIDEFSTLEEANAAIKAYEDEDKRNGDYTEDFYEVAEKVVGDYVVRTKKQSCSSIAAWVYKRENMSFDDEELNDGDSDYREFNSLDEAREYFCYIAGHNSNQWEVRNAIKAIKAINDMAEQEM